MAQEIFSIIYTIHCINLNENLSNEALGKHCCKYYIYFFFKYTIQLCYLFVILDILRDLESITECGKGNDLVGLYEQYIRGVLINVTSAINTWNEHSIDLAIINSCLTEVGKNFNNNNIIYCLNIIYIFNVENIGPALGSNLALLSPILTEGLTQNDVDPEVKIKIFNALSVMLLSKESSFSLSENEHLAAFLKIIVEGITY